MSEQHPQPAQEPAPRTAPEQAEPRRAVDPGRQAALGGGSAERKAEELAAAADPAAAAWAAGAEGERRVAAALSTLREAWTVLHDRLLRPGQSEANLDHVVIGPGGVFLVDAKNRGGRVVEWDGGLFQHLTRDGESHTVSLAGELKKVHGMSAYMAVEVGGPVTPVLCLAGAQEAAFGDPRMLRGIWVVPVSTLVTWLESRPPILDRETAARVVTRAMTDFPSTTTDPDLLAAMGQAAAQKSQSRRGARPARGPAPRNAPPGVRAARVSRPRRRHSLPARLGLLVGALLVGAIAIPVLTGLVTTFLTAGIARMADTPHAASAAATGTGATDCARVTGAQITKILGRKVLPVATSTGCAWGTRLDDPTTVVVSIGMSASHPAYATQLETSVKQHRVVYGKGTTPSFTQGTALWVAAGQPIGQGMSQVTAQADTTVVVAATTLKVSDDKARALALAVATAANSPQ